MPASPFSKINRARNSGARILVASLAAVALAAPSFALDFRLDLLGGSERLLRAKNGIAAADSRTGKALVRVISPGNSIGRFGTVRVLVMNLGPRPFEFGPENVRVQAGDGTVLPLVSNDRLDSGHRIVEKETARRNAVNARVSNNLSALAEAGSVGVMPRAQAPVAVPSAPSGAAGQSAGRLDRWRAPGEAADRGILAAIEGTLGPAEVAPQQASGGYLLFEIPKKIRSANKPEEVVFLVTVAGEVHRFPALLKPR